IIWSKYLNNNIINLQNRKSHIFTRQALLIYALFFICNSVSGQQLKKFSSRSYGVRDGLLTGRILDVAEDGNGFLWISTGVGLQRFDGRTFETIPAQAGLPQTDQLSLFKLKNGDVWLNDDNGITLYDVAADKFKRVFSFSDKNINAGHPNERYLLSGHTLIPLLETDKGVWCRNNLTKEFVCINKVSGQIEDSLTVPGDMQPVNSNYIKGYNHSVLYAAAGFALVEVDFSIKKILHTYRVKIPLQPFSACVPITKTDVIMASDGGISRVNITTGKALFSVRYPPLAAKSIKNTSLAFVPGGPLILSLNNQLFALNTANGRALYQLVDQQNGLFIDPAYIVNCITDPYNHLWVVSTTEGLVKINLNTLGIKYYGFGKLSQNFNRCIYADKKANVIITGSLLNGFSVFDTTQRLVKHFKLPNDAQTSCILKIQPSKYLLFAIGTPAVYLLDTKKLRLNPLPETQFMPSGILYQTYAQQLSDSTAVLFCNLSYFKVHFSKNTVRFTKGVVSEDFSAAIIDHRKRLWLGQTGKYLVLSGNGFAIKTPFYLPEKVKIQCFMEDNEGNMWVGTEKGLYRTQAENGKINAVYQQKDGLANDCIYSIMNDNNGNIWCGTNKGISGIYKSGKIINIHSSDGLQGDEFNTNSCAKADDDELFFGGINGVNSFYPDSMEKVAVQPKILMTDIKVMGARLSGEAAFTTRKIMLPYSSNIVAFSFIALGRYGPDEYTYQYRMTGIDKGWVNGGNSGYARYVLPPGDYTFEYTAGNAPARSLQHKKLIFISVTPPFWRSGWFAAISTLIILLSVAGSVKFYYKSINQKS
ncbi:MAG: hypothetical protein JST32_15775, partial [Bacteroidetes bacterium]|nr:hypothetical protein [Bacteroidota bacterium]